MMRSVASGPPHGSLFFTYNAQRFPFDHHKIGRLLLSAEYGERAVVFDIDEELTGKAERVFNVPNWDIADLEARVESMYMAVNDRNHSTFKIIISANRKPYFYIWKVLMPLVLIVMMSWSVFWIDPAQIGPQIAMSSTSMLTLIAFQFAMSNMIALNVGGTIVGIGFVFFAISAAAWVATGWRMGELSLVAVYQYHFHR